MKPNCFNYEDYLLALREVTALREENEALKRAIAALEAERKSDSE